MFDFLAQAVAAIGVAMSGFTPSHIEPTKCAHYGDIEYCYYKGDAESTKALYYLHGFGDGVRAWSHNYSTGQVETEWQKSPVIRPHIITISKNIWWYVDASQGRELSRFVDWIERRHLGFTPERVLYGESMGGHNAFRWAQDETGLFQKLALLCPAFPRHFVSNPPPTEGFPPWVALSEQLIQSYYSQSSKPTHNPLIPAADFYENPRLPTNIHIMVSSRDDFGFYPGGLELIRTLEGHPTLQTSFEEQNVKHCEMNAKKLAEFLLL